MAKKTKDYREDTELVHLGRAPEEYFGIVNPPVVKASSIIYKSLHDYESTAYRYARTGTPLTDKFEKAMAKLEGGFAAVSAPSGFSAITTVLFAFVKKGSHILISDVLYPPVRTFCDDVLSKLGVETEYYDPSVGAGIEKMIRPNTVLIYMESPGSGTFEIIDVPAVVEVARAKNIVTIFDNSWSGGILYKPLKHGVDISVQSITKYVGGHSDLMMGVAVAATEDHYKKIRSMADNLGVCPGSDETSLALRGLRTLKLRIRQNEKNALAVAAWLQKRPEVRKVYCPAFAEHENHELWKRDFKGTNGLLGVLLKPSMKAAVMAFVDSLELFPVANSWGGYESLLQPQHLERSVKHFKEEGTLLRLHIGLEDSEDLIADLEQGFEKFNKVSS